MDEDALVAELQTGRINALLDVTLPEHLKLAIHFGHLLADTTSRWLSRA